MHPAVPHDTEVTKQKSHASSYSTRYECGKVHPLSINKVPPFDTKATLIYVESTAKLGMMFCTIAIVFNDHQRLERVYQFFTNGCIYYSYYSIRSTLCKTDILSATPQHHYATPQGVATPSLGSPDLEQMQRIIFKAFKQISNVDFSLGAMFLLQERADEENSG